MFISPSLFWWVKCSDNSSDPLLKDCTLLETIFEIFKSLPIDIYFFFFRKTLYRLVKINRFVHIVRLKVRIFHPIAPYWISFSRFPTVLFCLVNLTNWKNLTTTYDTPVLILFVSGYYDCMENNTTIELPYWFQWFIVAFTKYINYHISYNFPTFHPQQ